MNLKNCPQCGKLFAADGSHKICPVCRRDEEGDFNKVKEYLWDNPHATIEEVHEDTGVERETIIKFVREDRLIAEGIELDLILECERCGAAISHGRFCENCQQELIDGFNPDLKRKDKKKEKEKRDPEEESKGQMFMADRIKRNKR